MKMKRRQPRSALVLVVSLLVGVTCPTAASAPAKTVALTFDGGPSGYTPKIERILQRKGGIKATFFWVGSRIAGYEKVVRRVDRRGHEIANHTWTHPHLTRLSTGAIHSQLARTNRRLTRLTGERPTLFRPPYGDVNRKVRRIARRLGLRTVLWGADSIDWMSDCQAIVRRVAARVRNRTTVLLHDGGGNRTATVCALPRIIRNLRSRGYRFVTVSELPR
jgi:peptidoglycan-N-acetylglucosamine deacetylase